VYPALPASGPGRQVLLVQYEHLDLLSPSSSASPRDASASAGSAGGGGRRGSRRAGDNKKKAAATKAEAISSSTSSGGVKEMLLQAVEYPLLLEGSHFWASPIVADPSGDGRPRALLADSTGGIYVVGLTAGPSSRSGGGSGGHRQRAFQSAQVPRLYVRREWVERRVRSALGSNSTAPAGASEAGADGVPAAAGKNESSGAADAGASVDDPYHTYFEYYYSGLDSSKHEKLLQGVSASAFSQDSLDRQRLLDRRRRQKRERAQMLQRKQQEQHGEENPGAAAAGEPAAAGEKGRAILPPKKYDDDFAGDDLEYMLAKQRNVEERGIRAFDDDYGRKHRQEQQQQQPQEHREDEPRDSAQAQRRRLQEEGGRSPEVVDAAAGDAKVHAQQHGGEGGDGGGGGDQQEREKNHGAAKEDLQGEGSRRGNREEAGGGEEEKEGRGRSYDDFAGDGPPRMNDIVDVDQQRATDDLIGPDAARDDPKYAMKYDDYYRYRHGGGDDTYRGHNERHREYYDTKHYIRIPPHVLCTPVLAELPKLYTNTDEKEDILFVAVSYFVSYSSPSSFAWLLGEEEGDE
jgi:hypothetical protein